MTALLPELPSKDEVDYLDERKSISAHTDRTFLTSEDDMLAVYPPTYLVAFPSYLHIHIHTEERKEYAEIIVNTTVEEIERGIGM